MNASPISSWESVAAYFTFADSPAVVMGLCALAAVAFVGFMAAIIKHENDAFDKHK